MVGADVDEAGVQAQIINAIGISPRHGGSRKVMPTDLARLFGGQPLPAPIGIVADQFLFLGVDRNHRQSGGKRLLHTGVDMPKLRVPVWMIGPFLGFSITLQTVILGVQELSHLDVADRMFFSRQFRRQGARALADPTQR